MSLSVLVRGTSSEIGILGALRLMHVQKVGEPKRQTCEIPTLCHSQNTCRAFLVGHGDSCAEVYGRSIPEKRSRQREGQAPGALRQVHQLQIDGASAPVAAALFRTCILCVWCVRSVASAAIHAASERSSIGLRAHILLLAWLGWLLSGKPNDGTRSRLPKRHALLSLCAGLRQLLQLPRQTQVWRAGCALHPRTPAAALPSIAASCLAPNGCQSLWQYLRRTQRNTSQGTAVADVVCSPPLAGIKKQACINRKCLLMVPRDEDGEKLARKRAKQRAIVPGDRSLGASATFFSEPSNFLTGINIQLPLSPASPRSGTSSPASPDDGRSPPAQDAAASSSVARKQQWSEASLFALALDDDAEREKRGLSSAMLFSAIRTPASSPQRSSYAARRQSASAADQAGSRESCVDETECTQQPDTPTRRAKRAMPSEPEPGQDDEEEEELRAAFTAHISAKLELEAPPPAQPPLDQLQEEFLLLNAEHRSSCLHETRDNNGFEPNCVPNYPILAF